MVVAILFWSFGLTIFCLGVVFFTHMKDGLSVVLTFMGLILLVTFTFWGVPQYFPSGLPMTSISAGEYKVAFVYVAGENVNIGIEKTFGSKENVQERLYLYRFVKPAFDGSINTGAKRLMVVESGGFKKLVLK